MAHWCRNSDLSEALTVGISGGIRYKTLLYEKNRDSKTEKKAFTFTLHTIDRYRERERGRGGKRERERKKENERQREIGCLCSSPPSAMKLRDVPQRKVVLSRRNQVFASAEVANILTGELDLIIYDQSSDDEIEDPSFVVER